VGEEADLTRRNALARELIEPVQYGARRIIWCRWDLEDAVLPALLVPEHEIAEGAAGVDGESVARHRDEGSSPERSARRKVVVVPVHG
jgi:hypothetical protein